MRKNFSVNIDHVGIINKNLKISSDIFDKLGFITGGASEMETGISKEKNPTNLHYMFDNSYIECIESKEGDYLSKYLKSPSALHTVVLASDEIETSNLLLKNGGYNITETMIAKRPANHGEKKGEAVFGWFKINDVFIPDTLLGVVEHKTRNLIFQPTRYVHKNGMDSISGIICCTEDNNSSLENFESFEKINSYLFDGESRYIKNIKVMKKSEIKDFYNVDTDPSRSPYAGIVFEGQSLDKIKEILESQNYSYLQKDDFIMIDFSKEIGLFFIFKQMD